MAKEPNDSEKLTQAQKDARDMTLKAGLAMELRSRLWERWPSVEQ